MGKGSNPVIGSWYGMKWLHMGICYGPVDQIDKITAADREVWSGTITDNTDIAIDKPDLFGGKHKEGGIQGTLSVTMGGADQQPHPTLVAAHGDLVPAFRGRVMLLFSGLLSAMTPYIKPWAVRGSRWVKGWRTPVWEPDLCRIGMGMNPAHFIYRAQTDPVTGLGLDPAETFDLDRMKAAAQTLHDEGLGLCLRWSRSDVVNNFVQTLCEHAGGVMATDFSTGKQYLKLLRGDYDISAVPLLDESNITELTSFEPGVLAGSINQIIVKYHDIETNKDASVPANDPANMQAQGGRLISQTKTYPGAWNADMAGQLAERDLRAYTALPAKIKLIVKGDQDVRKGDVRAFSWARLKISRMPIRIIEIDRGTPDDNKISLTCSQDVYSMPTAGWVTGQPALWTPPDLTPYALPAQQLVEASYRDLAGTMRPADLAQLTPDSGYVGALGARPSSIAYGYKLTTRVGTGGDYKTVGTAPFAATGTLQAVMPAEAGPTLITLVNPIDLDQVALGTEAVVDSEVCRVDGIDATTGAVTLARGCVDSVPAEHATGARVWFTDGHTGADPTEYLFGETVQAKLLTTTGTGTLDPAQASVISATLAQRPIRPYAPGALMIAGQSYPADVTVDLPVSWAHRDRLLQADQLVDTAQASIGPEPGTTYTVRVYQGSALKATYADIDGTSCTPDRLDADGQVRIEVEASRDGYKSWQRTAATFDYHWLKTMDQAVFGHGDGSTSEFQLLDDAGQAITSDITVESVYRTDWQGRQLLYRTARTNYAHPSEPTFATLSARGGSPAPLDDTIPTSSASFTPHGIQFPANPTVQQFAYVASSISHADVAVGQPLYFGLLVKSTSSTPPTIGVSIALVAFQRQAILDSFHAVPAGPNCWYYTCIAHVVSPPNASDTCGVARPIADPTPGETYTISALSMTTNASDAGAYIHTMTDARTVTDYALSTSGMVTMGETPVQDAVLDWSGTGR